MYVLENRMKMDMIKRKTRRYEQIIPCDEEGLLEAMPILYINRKLRYVVCVYIYIHTYIDILYFNHVWKGKEEEDWVET